ncbi:UbiA prenyltransferase family [Gorgonomyces haynaldii]|nr:UbiA prenyltransferase family [Gorgonomyces haynaldii]
MSTEKRTLSDRLKPYWMLARLDKPVGTWLLYLPCTWSILMAHQTPEHTLYTLGLFGAGSILMRGAGCTINDIWDRDFDGKVDRTKTRPIPSGQVTVPQAVGFLGLQSLGGLAVLMQFDWYSILVGAASLPLVASYPLFKRVTYWPQFVLGLTFNWGCLLGASAMLGAIPAWSLALYSAGVCWTLVYDTIYALQDTKDDKKIGIRSTALLFGDNSKPIMGFFASLSTSFLGLAGYLSGAGPAYYLISVGGALSHYIWQLVTLDTTSVKDCWTKFVSNIHLGMIVSGGILVDWIAQLL